MRPLAMSLLLFAAACGERAMIQDPTPARTAAAAPAQSRLQTATFALG